MIKDLLTSDMIKTEVEASSWRDGVNIVGSILQEHGKIEAGFIQSMISTVEQLGPYMILVPGIAFFHGHPDSGVHEVCLSFVTFKEDVVFTDFEQQHIQCAFGFGAVDANSHMEVLMQVAALFQDEEFLQLVRNHGSQADIIRKIQEY